MRIGYYPGCTLKTKAKNLEQAAIESMKALGIEMLELERWNCCGAVYSLADDDLIHILAPARDLIRAKDQAFDKVVTLCSMCYNTLARANKLMREDEVKRKTINTFMEEESDYAGEVEVIHFLNLIRDEIGWDKLKDAVKVPLTGLKLAPYYGCTLTRPNEIAIDDPLNPTIFLQFVEALGAEVADFDSAEKCCGSYNMVSNPEAAVSAAAEVIRSAEKGGADALILSCPLCEYNLSRKQANVVSANEDLHPLPVFYFTQLLAIALGLDPEVCKFELNQPDALAFLEEKGLLKGAVA